MYMRALVWRAPLLSRARGTCGKTCQGAAPSTLLSWCSADEAVSVVRSGQSVFVQGAAMTPVALVSALARRAGPSLKDVSVVSIHTEGSNELASEAAAVSFRVRAMFLGANVRAAVAVGRADYVPCFLSEIPGFFRSGTIPVDVAFVQVSPPDKHGFCSLGLSVDVAVAAVERAKSVIALVNPRVPRTLGDGRVHVSRIARAVQSDAPVARDIASKLEPLHERIGANVASLVDDGACVQAGIGLVPDAALLALRGHKQLGVHTEMFSDGLMDLLEQGVITNEHKRVQRGKTTTAFAVGSQRLLDYVDDNPNVLFLETSTTNDAGVIRQNPKTVAINSAIEVDITGQVVADSIGTYVYSGIGGQMDFMRGAALSDGGRPIIAFTSRTNKGVSRIVPMISPGAGVVTTRAHVYWVVTEHGIAELHGKSLRERALRLRDIAHPDDRAALDAAIVERFRTQG
ncbi:hypothetical protein KFE25_010811 [Diacronema lutheri]|uniref:Acetyl-CoA hydrolase n=2 Tax=Diacronema lutheri TaxID=2081491 RepID=A0A8J5X8J1_DIALT|nr:hypothetical protein KFE25_010811 [Diacronema lutheri]